MYQRGSFCSYKIAIADQRFVDISHSASFSQQNEQQKNVLFLITVSPFDTCMLISLSVIDQITSRLKKLHGVKRRLLFIHFRLWQP